LANGRSVKAHAVVVAAGARYRRPALPRLQDFEGRGLWYWASPIEARMCRKEEIALVGGGNSAGQAAVFLSSFAAKISMLVRANSLASSMSRYLIDRIEARPNIELLCQTEIVALTGTPEGRLERVRLAPRAKRARNGTCNPQCILVHWRRSGDQLVAGLRSRPRREGICPNGFASQDLRHGKEHGQPTAARIECPRRVCRGRCTFGLGQAGWRCHRRVVAQLHSYLAGRRPELAAQSST